MSRVRAAHGQPFGWTALMFGVVGVLLLSGTGTAWFTDGDVPAFKATLIRIVGAGLVVSAIMLAAAYVASRDTLRGEVAKWGEALRVGIVLDRYLRFGAYLLVALLAARLVFGRSGGIDTLYPLFATIDIKPFSVWIPVSLAVGVAWILGLAVLRRQRRSGRAFQWTYIAYVFVGALTLAVSLGLTDNGVNGLTAQFDNPGMQYPEDVHVIGDIGVLEFVGTFNEIQPTLSFHTTSHPPGPSIFYYAGYVLFGDNNVLFALQTIIVGCLSVIPLFFLIKHVLGESAAYDGIAVLAVVPSFLLFTATAFDTVILFLCLASVTLFYYALSNPRWEFIIACAAMIAAYALATFHWLVMGLLYVAVPVYFWKRDRSTAPLLTAGIIGTLVLLWFGALSVFMNYDYVESFFQTLDIVRSRNSDREQVRYWAVVFGNLLAFLIYLGLPTGASLVQGQNMKVIMEGNGVLKNLTWIIVGIIFVIDITLFGHFETERVWLFLVPFFVLPIVKIVEMEAARLQTQKVLYAFLMVCFLQAWVFQVALNTRW